MPKTAALRAAVFQLSAKNLRGGGCSNTPPGSARVKSKSYLKLNKKYAFSEGEQFPLTDDNDASIVAFT